MLAIALATIGPDVSAQDLEPRAYANTPVGLNFAIVGYTYVTGSIVSAQGVPLENAEIDSHVGILAYSRVLDVLGSSGKIGLALPYGGISGSAELAGMPRQRDVSGFGDPELSFTFNFFGAPALSLEEFADYEQDFIAGASLGVSMPLGQYDASKLLNIGTNRWAINPELGISKALGALILEASAGATFYTDNNDFFGGQTRSQDPLYSVQGHVIYGFESGIWVALDGTYYTGGRTTVDGIVHDDLQSNTRVGFTAAFPVDRHSSIKLFGSSGVSARFGGQFDALGLAWQYRWGGGL